MKNPLFNGRNKFTKKIQALESRAEPAEAKTAHDTPFYNVMPKGETKGPLIGPKLQTASDGESGTPAPNTAMKFIKEHKIWVIAMIAMALLAYPAYYLFNKYAIGIKGDQNLLSEEALKKLERGSEADTGQPEKLEFKTPKEWQARFFGNEVCRDLKQCGDEADPDFDGLKNIDEHAKETDPNNPDSDQDGLADGDEVFVFGTLPGNANSADDFDYNDADYIKGGYNPKKKSQKFTQSEIDAVSAKMKTFGLNQPTATTLKESLISIYKFPSQGTPEEPQASSTPISGQDELVGFELTPEAKQDRDTQRSNATKNIAIALVKYFEVKAAYPKTNDFKEMFEEIKVYTRVATNPTDPVNKGKYIYSYTLSSDEKDFTLTFFSETQGQVIKTKSADAKKYRDQEQAAIYDDQRKTNLQTLRTALLLYSNNNAGGNQEYVFPKKDEYPQSLLPEFITEIPKDPKTNEPYQYEVSQSFDSFTLKGILDNPPTGKTGYMCNQEECRYY
ncbi:MAG: hypothetical protein HYZ51_01690 [Candidatus Doudnabacteria bacterium]|nr:hypothetical protein [Candidatus Doudnabacteria bacterium]